MADFAGKDTEFVCKCLILILWDDLSVPLSLIIDE